MPEERHPLKKSWRNCCQAVWNSEIFEGRMGGEEMEEKERYEVVKDIQRSLNKLHQVFLDMEVLIENQGEQISDVEQNVVNAEDYKWRD